MRKYDLFNGISTPYGLFNTEIGYIISSYLISIIPSYANIWLIDGTLISITFLAQSGTGSNDNEEGTPHPHISRTESLVLDAV